MQVNIAPKQGKLFKIDTVGILLRGRGRADEVRADFLRGLSVGKNINTEATEDLCVLCFKASWATAVAEAVA